MTDEPVKPKVSANPALVEWPRDEWGSLSGLRAEILKACSSIRGNDEKHKLFLQTLGVGAQHAVARLKGDRDALVAEGLAEEARIAKTNTTGRVYGSAVA